MDSRILCISLLVAVFCLWSTEASPYEASVLDNTMQAATDMDYQKGSPELDADRSSVHEKRARVVGNVAKSYVTKAKVLSSQSRLNYQLAKDRSYYYREYLKLADEHKRKSREYEQQSETVRSRVAQHQARQREWESKYREANTQTNELEQTAQQERSQALELYRSSEVAYAEASIHEALAYGYQCKSERLNDWAKEMRRRGDGLLNDAKNHYTRGKEGASKATSEKVKSQHYAQDYQKHNAATMAYQQDAVRTHLSSTANMMKYMQNSLMAERYNNMAKEETIRAELSEIMANELANEATHLSSIAKALTYQRNTEAASARGDQTRALTMDESAREVQSSLTHAGSAALMLATAKDESPEIQGHQKLPIHPADDPVKFMADDAKELSGDEEP